MFSSIDDVEDPIYLMDLPPPLNYFEFDSSILQWSNIEPVISTPNSLVLSHGDIKVTKKKTRGDRHSKIPTANGLRDRRVRLSLDVASQFFKLQDMLSFDKPSKTVKWLLSQAKSAIEEVDKGDKGSFFGVAKSSTSSISEGEVVENAIDDRKIVKVVASKEKCGKKMKKESRSVGKQVRKKLRDEARERARERTQKKINDRLRLTREESQDCNVFEIEQQIQNGRNAFGTTMDFVASNWSSLVSNHHQVNPNPEFQQFHGASGEFYSHPNEGNQYWNY